MWTVLLGSACFMYWFLATDSKKHALLLVHAQNHGSCDALVLLLCIMQVSNDEALDNKCGHICCFVSAGLVSHGWAAMGMDQRFQCCSTLSE